MFDSRETIISIRVQHFEKLPILNLDNCIVSFSKHLSPLTILDNLHARSSIIIKHS